MVPLHELPCMREASEEIVSKARTLFFSRVTHWDTHGGLHIKSPRRTEVFVLPNALRTQVSGTGILFLYFSATSTASHDVIVPVPSKWLLAFAHGDATGGQRWSAFCITGSK